MNDASVGTHLDEPFELPVQITRKLGQPRVRSKAWTGLPPAYTAKRPPSRTLLNSRLDLRRNVRRVSCVTPSSRCVPLSHGTRVQKARYLPLVKDTTMEEFLRKTRLPERSAAAKPTRRRRDSTPEIIGVRLSM